MIRIWQLDSVFMLLDIALLEGKISIKEYVEQSTSVLSTFGLSEEQFAKEIDRRWDYIMKEHRVDEVRN